MVSITDYSSLLQLRDFIFATRFQPKTLSRSSQNPVVNLWHVTFNSHSPSSKIMWASFFPHEVFVHQMKAVRDEHFAVHCVSGPIKQYSSPGSRINLCKEGRYSVWLKAFRPNSRLHLLQKSHIETREFSRVLHRRPCSVQLNMAVR